MLNRLCAAIPLWMLPCRFDWALAIRCRRNTHFMRLANERAARWMGQNHAPLEATAYVDLPAPNAPWKAEVPK